jgi:hypothetical protein
LLGRIRPGLLTPREAAEQMARERLGAAAALRRRF